MPPQVVQYLFLYTGPTDEQENNQRYFSNGLPYFFGYKTEFFSFQNNPKYLDPSYKMDLDLLDCLGRVKLVL